MNATLAGHGYCSPTPDFAGDCEADQKGSWPLTSLSACIERCRSCARCRYVSISRKNSACDWFTYCDPSDLRRAPAAISD